MRILWVKSGGLVPLDHGGKIRSYHLARALARLHDVALFTFYAETPDDGHKELETIFSRVISIPLRIVPPRTFRDYSSYFRNLFSWQPYSAKKYCQPQVAQALLRHLDEARYDVIVCDFLLTAAVIPRHIPTPKVLFTHNVEAMIWQRHYQVARNPVWKAVCYREYRTMADMERRFARQADRVLVVSDVDRSFFARFVDPAKISVVPTGVEVEFFRPIPGQERQSTLVFTGSMDWLPNEDGVIYFVQTILPRIRSRVPDVQFWIVGRRPSERLQALAATDRTVQVTGTVEDVRPYIGQGCVYLVPLFVGGGTRLKIFEAMAMGKAIVSTTVGAEGLPVTPGQNILLADSPGEFADAVIGLLQNAPERARLGTAARTLVEKHYSWAAVARQLEGALWQAVREWKVASPGEQVSGLP